MTKTMKRTLTIILTFVMILSTMTMSFAAGTSDAFETIYLDEVNTVYIYEEDEPVFVKFTPTESGWYLIASDNDGDDENVDPYVCIFDADGEEIAYDDDSIYEDTYNFYCEFEAEAGETYYIALCAYEADVSYDYVITKYIDIDHQPTVDEPYVTLTWDMVCEYQWFEITGDDILAIEGETEATLKNLQVGSAYVCVVTIDGVEYYSDMILYTYAITHQPTIDEPYVELNDNTDAIYQWCSAEEAVVEVTDENATGFAFADDPLTISEIVKRINDLVTDENMTKLTAPMVTEWLVNIGVLFIEMNTEGKNVKRPSPQGISLGISVEARTSMNGPYSAVIYNRDAQQFVIDNLDAALDMYREKTENQGQPWNPEHDRCLLDLHQKGVPMREIAVTLKRNAGAVRARLKKLGASA